VVQPVAFFIDDTQQFVSLRSGNFPAGKQACYRRFHEVKGRAEIVRDGIQPARTSAALLVFRLRLAELFYGSRAFDMRWPQAADGVERLRESLARKYQDSDGPHAETYWGRVNTPATTRWSFHPRRKAVFIFSSSRWAAPYPDR